MRDAKRHWDISVMLIIVVVLGLLWASVTTLFHMRETMEETSHRFVDGVSDIVFAKTVGYLEPIVLLSDMVKALDQVKPDFIENEDALNRIGSTFLSTYPQLQAFIIGNQNGDFYYLKSEVIGQYNVRIIHPDPIAPSTIDYQLDSQLTRSKYIKSDSVDFDPRVRPWYSGARVSEKQYWSNLYLFYLDKVLGMTISQSFDDAAGKFAGVFGFDIDLYGLSDFLAQMNLGQEGRVMIVNGMNQVVAYSDTETIFNDQNIYKPENVDINRTPVFAKLLALDHGSGNSQVFEVDGIQYTGKVISLGKALKADWRIATLFPLSEFLHPFQLTLQYILILTGFTLLLIALLWHYRFREKKAISKLEYIANHDLLTGLKSRNWFSNRFRTHLEKSKSLYSLILIDVDHFKAINDRYGHQLGDLVLVKIAETVLSRLKPQQTAIRWGGEEFLIVVEGSDKAKAAELAEDLRSVIEGMEILVENQKLLVTLSFGVAERAGHDSFKDTIQLADNKLYEAKKAGRNRVCS